MTDLTTVPRLMRRSLARLILEAAERNRPGSKVIAAFHKAQRTLEPQFMVELEKEFSDLGVWVAIVAEGQNVLQEAADPVVGDEGRVNRILQRANISQWVQEHIKPLFERQWRRVLDSTVHILNEEQIPVKLHNAIAQELLDMGAKRIGLLDIEEDTRIALMSILKEARERGMNPRRAAKLIEDKVPAGRFQHAGSKYRAELIARTETLQSQRASSLKLYETSSVVKQVEAYDGESDDLCASRNGEIFSFEEAELEMMNTHPNCVLAFGPVV